MVVVDNEYILALKDKIAKLEKELSELKSRDIAGECWDYLKVYFDNSIYSKVTMYDNFRMKFPDPKEKNIVERIIEKKFELEIKNLKPKYCYLGEQEWRELWDSIRNNNIFISKDFEKPNKINGLILIKVYSDSHLSVSE